MPRRRLCRLRRRLCRSFLDATAASAGSQRCGNDGFCHFGDGNTNHRFLALQSIRRVVVVVVVGRRRRRGTAETSVEIMVLLLNDSTVGQRRLIGTVQV